MNTSEFFDHLIAEIKENEKLRHYYRFLNNPSTSGFYFRKAYYMQRLDYIDKHIVDKNGLIWDLGCGYGTTAIYLALNGFKVYGTTIEYYYDEIQNRLKYWEQFGDLSGLKFEYENIFTQELPKEAYKYVIVQDVLHHIEPINEGLERIARTLEPDGAMVVCEENGNNLINRFKLFLRRGNKRIIKIKDEKTGEYTLLGNENTRSLRKWKKLIHAKNMAIDDASIEYVRVLPPLYYRELNYDYVINKEKELWKKYRLLRDYFYFGINFMAYKQ
ncbi:MAG: methyltransferase domain-containing protein [Bacteroidetes bacterium]|jgi:2-polyprenyl-3-methyl-5-hydroxy-6-metoxy-1,4-benzoquinol methylase|nr:methyltransferase domain-containing protein [Bacteroidota bacterium]